MKDKDKVWICYKINVDGVLPEDTYGYITEVARMFNGDGSVQNIFIPVRNEPNEITLIYDPKGYRNKNNKKNLKLAKEKLKNINEIYKK